MSTSHRGRFGCTAGYASRPHPKKNSRSNRADVGNLAVRLPRPLVSAIVPPGPGPGRRFSRLMPEGVWGPTPGALRPAHIPVAPSAVPKGLGRSASYPFRLGRLRAAADHDVKPAEGSQRRDTAQPRESRLRGRVRVARRGLRRHLRMGRANWNECQGNCHNESGKNPSPHPVSLGSAKGEWTGRRRGLGEWNCGNSDAKAGGRLPTGGGPGSTRSRSRHSRVPCTTGRTRPGADWSSWKTCGGASRS